jgi:hypothetical protein
LKIILSRKGFDSSNGGVPNPILPDRRLVVLPIPAARDPHTYDEVTINGIALGPLVEDLTACKIARTRRCHLDPDLDAASLPRLAGWRPAFGQIDAAQAHLARNGVSAGDLFLFFGWFRAVEKIGGHWRYIRSAPHLHIIYGWMEIGKVIGLANSACQTEDLAPFADHPHLHGRDRPSNTLYLASSKLNLPYSRRDGGGIFRLISDRRILTDQRQFKRSVWRLPAWFHPGQGTVLSYHEQRARWALAGSECTLSSAGRGQEFILTTASRDAAESWLEGIFSKEES